MSIISVDLLESDDDSIIELIPPSKPAPIVVDVDVEEEIVINVSPTPRLLTPTKAVAVVVRNQTPINENKEDSESLTDTVSPYHWTNEMRTFYNDDWGNEENFVLEDLLNMMPSARRFWNVSRPLMPSSIVVCCFSCNKYHKNKYCRSNTCHMCGTEGHLAARCPQRMCLTCGKRGKSFTSCCPNCRKNRSKKCSRCSVYGHSVIDCTDNWRRFHNTTSKATVETPDVPAQKRLNEIWCCNCGRQGHIEVNCRVAPGHYHLPSSTLVSSYDSSFNVDKAGGLDFRKNLGFDESEIPNFVQPPPLKPPTMKRKRYFVMPSDDEDDISAKRHKNNDGSTPRPKRDSLVNRKANKKAGGPNIFYKPPPESFNPNVPEEINLRFDLLNDTNFIVPQRSLHNSADGGSAAFKRPQAPKRHNYKCNAENSNATDVTIASKLAAGPIIYYKSSATKNSTPSKTGDEELTPKRQNNCEAANFSTARPEIVDEVVGAPASSSNVYTTPKRNNFKPVSKNPFSTPAPSFIPLVTKKKKNKKNKNKNKNKKNQVNKNITNEPMEKSIKKTLIGANQTKAFKKKERKDERVSKFIERRWRQADQKWKKMQLNQNRKPVTPSVPSHSQTRPSNNHRPVQNERGAIQRWNNYLLGV